MKIRRIDFSPDEWIAGTVGMTLEEEGLYIRVCALIYSHGGPIGTELLKRACQHDHGNRVNACLARLLSTEKLIRNGLEIDQKRCRKELEKASIRAGKGRENESEYSNPNGLESPRARTRAGPRARSINHQLDLELSGLTARESSEPSRLRAREGASGGASHTSAAPNHQSKRSRVEAVPEAPWPQRCRAWVETGFWNALWGPSPCEPGCYAPNELAAEARQMRNGAGK